MCQTLAASLKYRSTQGKGQKNIERGSEVATANQRQKRVHASQVIPHTNEETQVERRSKRLKPPPDPTHVGPTPVDAANTNPHIPQPPVANPVTQE